MTIDRSASQYAAERLSVDALIPYAKNARTHKRAQVTQLAEAIRKWGFTNPILVDEDGGIIAGHGRVLAAKEIGLPDVPVIRVAGLDDAEKRALVLADNQLALNSGWDRAILAAEIGDLKAMGFDLGLLGFDAASLQEMTPTTPRAGLTHPDDAPGLSSRAVSVTGDVWILGGAQGGLR